MTWKEFNGGEVAVLTPRLLECCGSARWVEKMIAERPYHSQADLEETASALWQGLQTADWLEAFSKHPKIGEKGKVSQWSAQEQSGMDSAALETANRLAELNQVYFEKFGFIFIVCATGKSAAEMLSLLEARLPNEPDKELGIAAGEQDKITILRLRKMLAA